jgi:hypothetical protein
MIIRSTLLVLSIALLVFVSNEAYKSHKENVAIEKTMQSMSRNRWIINGKQLEKFFEHHPDYYCHLHMRNGKHTQFVCFEPGTYQS